MTSICFPTNRASEEKGKNDSILLMWALFDRVTSLAGVATSPKTNHFLIHQKHRPEEDLELQLTIQHPSPYLLYHF